MVLFCYFPNPLKIVKSIIMVVEYILPIVSPLQGMMTYVGYDKMRVSWHARNMPGLGAKCNRKIGVIPFLSGFSNADIRDLPMEKIPPVNY